MKKSYLSGSILVLMMLVCLNCRNSPGGNMEEKTTGMAADTTLSGIRHAYFKDTIDGKGTTLYVLTNSKGTEAVFTNSGNGLFP